MKEPKFENYNDNISKLLKQCFDSIWNACGFESSMYYTKEDEWKRHPMLWITFRTPFSSINIFWIYVFLTFLCKTYLPIEFSNLLKSFITLLPEVKNISRFNSTQFNSIFKKYVFLRLINKMQRFLFIRKRRFFYWRVESPCLLICDFSNIFK